MNTYQKVLELISGYFANVNAADVFLTRQCKFHLSKEPAQVTMNDLWNLAHWTMVSGALLLGKGKAEEMSDKILSLRKQMSGVPGAA